MFTDDFMEVTFDDPVDDLNDDPFSEEETFPESNEEVMQPEELWPEEDLELDNEDPLILEPEINNEDTLIYDSDAPAYDNFDPAESDPSNVVGVPEADMDNWHEQETGTSCAVASQEFILEELTGEEFEESDLRDLAEANGWYDLNGGTPMNDVGNILEYMGLEVEQSQGNSIEDLQECLNNDGKVIVGVDSSELWYGDNDDIFGPGMDADHAVQVIGIDYNNPDQPMVILNDPGCSNGCGATVPMDDFLTAWEDSGCFMVEAYPN